MSNSTNESNNKGVSITFIIVLAMIAITLVIIGCIIIAVFKSLKSNSSVVEENAPDINIGVTEVKSNDLYTEILHKISNSIKTGDIAVDESYSYMYAQYGHFENSDFAFICLDINGDGVEELIVGENGTNDYPSQIYDLYTVADGELVHLFCGGERNRLYYTDTQNIMLKEGSSGAETSVHEYCTIERGSMMSVDLVIEAEKRNLVMKSFSELD